MTAKQFKQTRQRLGYTQGKLAETLQLSRMTISRYEASDSRRLGECVRMVQRWGDPLAYLKRSREALSGIQQHVADAIGLLEKPE